MERYFLKPYNRQKISSWHFYVSSKKPYWEECWSQAFLSDHVPMTSLPLMEDDPTMVTKRILFRETGGRFSRLSSKMSSTVHCWLTRSGNLHVACYQDSLTAWPKIVPNSSAVLASSPGPSHILSCSRGEKSWEGLGSKLHHGPEMVDSVSTNRVHVMYRPSPPFPVRDVVLIKTTNRVHVTYWLSPPFLVRDAVLIPSLLPIFLHSCSLPKLLIAHIQWVMCFSNSSKRGLHPPLIELLIYSELCASVIQVRGVFTPLWLNFTLSLGTLITVWGVRENPPNFQLPTSAPLDLDTPACMGMVELILADRQTDRQTTTLQLFHTSNPGQVSKQFG